MRNVLDFMAAAASVTLLLSGCASAKKTYGPDGKPVIALNCSGTARSWNACLDRAGEECGTNGYTVIERQGEDGTMIGGDGKSFYGSSTRKRTMVIECKTP